MHIVYILLLGTNREKLKNMRYTYIFAHRRKFHSSEKK